MTPNQAIVSLLYGLHKGKQLRDCPPPFIKWLLSSCQSPPSIKSCNFLIEAGEFAKRRIDSLASPELKQFAADDSQGIWQHQIAKDKLARIEDEQRNLDRSQKASQIVRPVKKTTTPSANESLTASNLPRLNNKTILHDGISIQLFDLSLAELRALKAMIMESWKRNLVNVAIKYKTVHGEEWKP